MHWITITKFCGWQALSVQWLIHLKVQGQNRIDILFFKGLSFCHIIAIVHLISPQNLGRSLSKSDLYKLVKLHVTNCLLFSNKRVCICFLLLNYSTIEIVFIGINKYIHTYNEIRIIMFTNRKKKILVKHSYQFYSSRLYSS